MADCRAYLTLSYYQKNKWVNSSIISFDTELLYFNGFKKYVKKEILESEDIPKQTTFWMGNACAKEDLSSAEYLTKQEYSELYQTSKMERIVKNS